MIARRYLKFIFIPLLSTALPSQANSEMTNIEFFHATTDKINSMKLSQASKDDILLFGDSITQGLNYNDIAFNHTNLGVGGDTVSKILERVKATDISSYKGVYFFGGVNDILNGRSGVDISNDISDAINYISPKVKDLYVSEVFIPNQKAVFINGGGLDLINANIASYCERFINCHLIALPEGLTTNKVLKPEMSISDGTHLNADGYRLWKAGMNNRIASLPERLRYSITINLGQ